MAEIWCLRDGSLGIGDAAPNGALLLLQGESAAQLQAAIEGIGRLAYDNTTWLVPGVPEAGDDEVAALDAAIVFQARLAAKIKWLRTPGRCCVRPLKRFTVVQGGRV